MSSLLLRNVDTRCCDPILPPIWRVLHGEYMLRHYLTSDLERLRRLDSNRQANTATSIAYPTPNTFWMLPAPAALSYVTRSSAAAAAGPVQAVMIAAAATLLINTSMKGGVAGHPVWLLGTELMALPSIESALAAS